jgi:signal transduction histidine kinase
MTDFSQLLRAQAGAIEDRWVQAVLSDRQIPSSDQLPASAIRNHVSHVLEALVTVLAQSQENDVSTIVQASLQHGALRAEQGFDASEIAREYHLLRSTIMTTLRPALMQSQPEAILRAVSLIDLVVDAAISQCFKSYVGERLHELEQMQHQLTLTNQELNRLVCANQDNLSLLAHELKTPLTSIIGYSELFLRQQKQAETRDTIPRLEHIERVLRNGRQLLQVINDALELSRYEAGKMQIHPAPLEVRSLIESVVEVVQPLADNRGLRLELECDRAPVWVTTDSLRVQQVLSNLVSNALRYTEQGSVTISCVANSNSSWTIAVRDTGIGIDPEDQVRIFEPFYRGFPNDSARFPGSTGLGLAIVARLVRLLHGRIEVNSELGVGSTFTVVLPLHITQAETALHSVLS